MKRILIIVCCIMLVACRVEERALQPSGNVPIAEPNDGQHFLKMSLNAKPISLDPQGQNDENSQQIISQIYCGLFKYEGEQIVKALCRDYQVSDDGLTYNFDLIDSQWSDGSALTAHDFEYSIKRIVNRQNKCSQLYYASNIAGFKDAYRTADSSLLAVKALSDSRLQIRLEQRDPSFIKKLTLPVFMPVSMVSVIYGDEWYHNIETLRSNGPFKLSQYNPYKSEQLYILSKNTHYYHTDRPRLATIYAHLIVDEGARNVAIQHAAIDICYPLKPVEVKHLSSSRHPTYKSEHAEVTALIVNQDCAPLQARQQRQLINKGIDRSALAAIEELPPSKAASGLVPDEITEESKWIRTNHFAIDLDSARALTNYQKSVNGKISLRMVVHKGQPRQEVSNYLKLMLSQTLGYDIELVQMNWQDYQRAMTAGDYDLLLVETLYPIATYRDILGQFSLYSAQSFWKNAHYQTLLERSAQYEEKERVEYLKKAERLLLQEAIVIPLFYNEDVYYIDKHLRNCHMTETGYWSLERCYFEEK